MGSTVIILNPWDSQGNQVADSNGVYPTIRGCGGAGYQQGYLLQRKRKIIQMTKPLIYAQTVGALQAVDYKGPNRQYVEADKLIIEIVDSTLAQEETEREMVEGDEALWRHSATTW